MEVVLAEPPGSADRWRISRGSDCNRLLLEDFQGSNEISEKELYRGKVRLLEGRMCPIGSNCDANVSAYCGDPPPACDEMP